jgi:hypothetical protein
MTTQLDYEFVSAPDSENKRVKPSKDTIIRAEKERPKLAVDYEKKIQSLLHTLMKSTAGDKKTAADAATVIRYGPEFAEKAGDLAEHDERARKAIELISAPDNPYVAFAFAALPLALQLIRNHESDNSVESRELRIPFTKGKRKFRLRFRLRLKNKFLRGLSDDPQAVTRDVFSDPKIRAALDEQGIDVAYP